MRAITSRMAPYDLGALDDVYAPLGCACDQEALGDLLAGAAGKGAAIGASVGSFIPGIGTAVGGAVGAAAGAISDFVGSIGKTTCKDGNGNEIQCPPCGITDLDCFKRWALARANAAQHPAPPAAVRDAVTHIRPPQAVARRTAPRAPAHPMRAMARRPAPPLTAGAHVDALAREPEHSSALPIALGVAAVAAAGGGAWWWWKNNKDQ